MPGKTIYNLYVGGATFPIPEKTLLQKILELKDSKANCVSRRRTKFSEDEIKKYVERSGRNPEKEKKRKKGDSDLHNGFGRFIYDNTGMPLNTQMLLDKFEDLKDCTALFAIWDSQRQAMFDYIKKHGHPSKQAESKYNEAVKKIKTAMGNDNLNSAASSAYKEFYTNYMSNLKASGSEPDGKKRRANMGEAWQESLDNPNLGRDFSGKNNKTRNFGQNSSAKEYKDAKPKRVVNMRQNRTSKKAKLVKGNEAAAANFEV
ncbi:hypothetical protein Rhopal_001318-T1 [Rhodotorula paludigena]|uniref:Uncharacterized protein n=1 Tax=Rhodotorula paludigena TaxID=86838 RepID=A0AAV5GDI1_9BASI|nr:hypothetical protein Rhopal_001318-T1 [Rhodotorula paludigena]